MMILHQPLKTVCFQFISLQRTVVFISISKKAMPAKVIRYAILVLLRIIWNVNMQNLWR